MQCKVQRFLALPSSPAFLFYTIAMLLCLTSQDSVLCCRSNYTLTTYICLLLALPSAGACRKVSDRISMAQRTSVVPLCRAVSTGGGYLPYSTLTIREILVDNSYNRKKSFHEQAGSENGKTDPYSFVMSFRPYVTGILFYNY
ncbi:hypothetical protein EVAR_70176_1 [Eumeta japonica]|uniref:Uncharacterized protein n=1 Tax=Eumeta variegata TaxID=151549 RepID=A0A4C1T5W3_EUMVA|nr:hypothetical protein EVAR_70176_1 [Eumeta japonica]